MKPRFLPLVLVSFLPLPLLAEEPVSSDDKDSLLALLDEQTAIATRTRMNADYVPGMVTVLHGEDLEARGFRTVWEALALVPGMETAMEKTGRRRVLVRGLGNTWASGNVKILLNDVSMNSAELGLAEPVFNIPVEQVDRIEVIRGPGSAIYGEYAYMGVINVITHSEQSRVFAFGGSFDTKGAGGILNFSTPENPIQASLNIAGWRSSGPDVKTGKDLVYAFDDWFPEGAENVSNAPGRANEDVESATAAFKLGYEHFSLTAHWTQDGLGDHFGTTYFLPPDHNRIVERTRIRTLDMRQEIPVTSALMAGFQLSWKDVERTRDHLFGYPASSVAPGNYMDTGYLETANALTADFSYRGIEKHSMLLVASTENVRVGSDWSRNSTPGLPPLVSVERYTRQLTAVTLQDEYRRSDLFTGTTGVRYDEYSDGGIHYSPRVAGVWRLADRHIIKAQYAEAFRPPTLFEAGVADYMGEEQPTSATIRTSEAGYIFKGIETETRVTAFHSRLEHLVVFVQEIAASGGFATRSATASGIEIEHEWRPGPEWTAGGNISYVDTRDEGTGAPFPGSATSIANASVGYRAGAFLGSLQLHHVSGFYRQAEDSRSSLPGYTTLDFTGTIQNLPTKGYRLRLGVKNLFDATVRYPAPMVGVARDPDPEVITAIPTYQDDYPQAGRTWWAQVSYLF